MAFVKTEVQGAVEIITIDRPKALNALNPEVLADLKAAFEAVDQETIRCIVLTGEGDKSFVAGADIGSMNTCTHSIPCMMSSWRIGGRLTIGLRLSYCISCRKMRQTGHPAESSSSAVCFGILEIRISSAMMGG